ncbi:hypothetical protein OXX80_012229 [Metschnikowia pulcherrima]
MSLLVDSGVSISTQMPSITMLSGLQQVTVVPSEDYVHSDSQSTPSSTLALLNDSSIEVSSSPSSTLARSSAPSSDAAFCKGSRNYITFMVFLLLFINVGFVSM